MLPALPPSLNGPFRAVSPGLPFLGQRKPPLSPLSSHPYNRPSFQTRPLVHRDRFLSPGSRWAGTTVTNSAQGVDYAFSGSPPTSSQAPRAPRPHIGQGARDKSPQIPHTTASPAAAEERCASVLRATSDLARDWVQLRERSAVPAHALPMGCEPASRRKEGCALSSLHQ